MREFRKPEQSKRASAIELANPISRLTEKNDYWTPFRVKEAAIHPVSFIQIAMETGSNVFPFICFDHNDTLRSGNRKTIV